jgi:hypothetical protein
MTYLLLLLLWLCAPLMAKTAPVFFEPHHYFDFNIQQFNEIDYVFNGRGISAPQRLGVSFAHQTREWDYYWVLTAAVWPTQYGTFGLGYSIYSSSQIPITTQNQIGATITGHATDSFESFIASIQPRFSLIHVQLNSQLRWRKLINHNAHSANIDIQATSPFVLNNQLGIRTKNLISTSYKWDTYSETLPKYIGVFYRQPIKSVVILAEYDNCLNYTNLSVAMGHISIQLIQELGVFSSYRSSSFTRILSIGTTVQLSGLFDMTYVNQTESNENLDLSIHSISIGVRF